MSTAESTGADALRPEGSDAPITDNKPAPMGPAPMGPAAVGPGGAPQGPVLLVALHDGFKNKPSSRQEFAAQETSGTWRNAYATPRELIAHISDGNSWLASHLKSPQRNEDNFDVSNLIVLDIDGDTTIEEFWQIPFVKRHCLFTATSYNHLRQTEKNPDAKERFRAVFQTYEHKDVGVHNVVYRRAVECLDGLELKDNCGEKPERLWFGNSNALVRMGESCEKLPWDWMEDAEETVRAEEAAAQDRGPIEDFDDIALQRCAWVLRNVLPPSRHNSSQLGYDAYFQRVMNAAAGAGDALRDLFKEWASKGEHHEEIVGRRFNKRWERSGNRCSPLKLLTIAKEVIGPAWRDGMPEDLKTSPSRHGPASLMSARSTADLGEPRPEPVAPESSNDAEAKAETPKVAKRLTATYELPPEQVLEPGASTAKAPGEDEPELDNLLTALYEARLMRYAPPKGASQNELIAFVCREGVALQELCKHYPIFNNNQDRLEEELLRIFQLKHGFDKHSFDASRCKAFDGVGEAETKWLVRGQIMEGLDHVLYSEPGVGKTRFALHLARALTGDPEVESFLDSGSLPTHAGWKRDRVLMIATDMGAAARSMTATYAVLNNLAGLSYWEQIDFWHPAPDGSDDGWTMDLYCLKLLHDHLESHQQAGTPVKAIIIDSMKAVCPRGILVGQQSFKTYLEITAYICRKFNAALIWIHHSGTDGKTQGIKRITEMPAGVMRLKRGEGNGLLTLQVEKIRGGARPRDVNFRFTDTGIHLVHSPDADDDLGDDQGSGLERAICDVIGASQRQWQIKASSLGSEVAEPFPGLPPKDVLAELNRRRRSKGWKEMCRRTFNDKCAALIRTGLLAAEGTTKDRRIRLADAPPQETVGYDSFDFGDDSDPFVTG